MVIPLLPFYAQTFAASATQIGFLASSHALANFFASPLLGRISDRFGRRPVLISGLLAGALSMTLMGVANSLLMLLLARVAHGIVAGAIMPTARAYVGDITSKEHRVASMGKIGAAMASGMLLGPAISSGLVAVGEINTPFFVAAAVSIFNALSVTMFLPESLKQKSQKLVIKDGFLNFFTVFKSLKSEQGILFLILFSWSFSMSNKQVSFPLLGQDRFGIGPETIGYFFTAAAIISIIMQGYLLPKIINLLGEKQTIFLGLMVMGLSTLILPFSLTLTFLIPFYLLWGVGGALNRPTAEGIISRISQVGQGTTMGIAHSFESLGRVFGPLLGGFLYGQIAPEAPFILSALMLIILAFAGLRYIKISNIGGGATKTTLDVD